MNTRTTKIATIGLGLTVLSYAANHLYPVAPPTVCPPPAWTQRELDCGPGPRVLVVGGSVALGWGASGFEQTWWVQACRRVGGTWRNAADAAKTAGDALAQMEANRGFAPGTTLALVGANDLVYGLAPAIAGQLDARLVRFISSATALRAAGATVILQPIPLGAESFEASGHEDEIRAAYATMAQVADVDLSLLPVDYVDLIHFGDRGQRIVADAIVERLR